MPTENNGKSVKSPQVYQHESHVSSTASFMLTRTYARSVAIIRSSDDLFAICLLPSLFYILSHWGKNGMDAK
jgi:hypothetical protein